MLTLTLTIKTMPSVHYWGIYMYTCKHPDVHNQNATCWHSAICLPPSRIYYLLEIYQWG